MYISLRIKCVTLAYTVNIICDRYAVPFLFSLFLSDIPVRVAANTYISIHSVRFTFFTSDAFALLLYQLLYVYKLFLPLGSLCVSFEMRDVFFHFLEIISLFLLFLQSNEYTKKQQPQKIKWNFFSRHDILFDGGVESGGKLWIHAMWIRRLEECVQRKKIIKT